MEEIEEGERNHEDDRNKHTEDRDILEIVNSVEGGRRKAEGSLRVPGEQPCTIYHVSKVLGPVNEKHYEPQFVSIGPLHCRKERLKPMEEKKFQYLLALLSRNPKLKLEDIAKEIKKLEANARKCYSESICLDSKEFVEMMVFDGCCLVEIFLRSDSTEMNDEPWLPRFISSDMLLLENQLPFFILQSIFSLVVPEREAGLMKKLLLDCFRFIYVLPLNEDAAMKESYHHVLDVFHHHCLPTYYADPNAAIKEDTDIEAQYHAKEGPDMVEGRSHAGPNSNAQLSRLASPLGHVLIRRHRKRLLPAIFMVAFSEENYNQLPFEIPSAEELDYAGVKFQRKEETPGSFLDIEFHPRGAVMKISYLYFSDSLLFIFRNLIAYEQCNPKVGTVFTAYALFMDVLIDTAKDVQILRHSRILKHGLGSDEELALHFNQLSKGIFSPCQICSSLQRTDGNQQIL